MSSGDIAVRMLLAGRREYIAGLREVERENKRAAAESKAASRAGVAASGEQAAASRAAATAARGAADAQVAGFGAIRRSANAVKPVVRAVGIALPLAAAAFGFESVKAASHFQSAMTLVNTMAGVSKDRINALSNGLLSMAPGVAAGPTALADALYRISSAKAGLGATNAELLDMTRAAAQLNLIGGGNDSTLGETARVLGGVSASGIKGAGGVKGIVGLAAATVGSGDMKMPDFLAALGTGVLPTAATYGVKLPDIGAMLSVLTDNLIPGATAGNQINRMLTLLASPSGTGLKGFEAVGLHQTDLAESLRKDGLVPTLQLLRKQLAAPETGGVLGRAGQAKQLGKFGFTDAQANQMMTKGANASEQAVLITKMFGGKQAMPVRLALTELDRLAARSGHIAAVTKGGPGPLIDAALATFQNRVKQLHAALKVLEIRVGNFLIPIILKLGHYVMDVARYFKEHRTQAEFLAITFGTVLVIALGAFTYAMVAAGLAFIGATWPISLIVIGIGLLVAGLITAYRHSETFRKIVNMAFEGVKAGVGLAVFAIITTFRNMLKVWLTVAGGILSGAASAFGWVPGIGDKLKGASKAFDVMKDKILGTFDGVAKSALTFGATAAGNFATGLASKNGLIASSLDDGITRLEKRFTNIGGVQVAIPQYGPSPATPARVGGLQARAGGGPVTAGVPYLVGERRPEVFVPSQSGRIVSSVGAYQQQGGGTQMHFAAGAVVVSNGMSPDEVYRQMGDAVDDRLARQLVS